MNPTALLRGLTPLGWLAATVLAVAALCLAGRGMGLRWDPLGLSARRLAVAERRVELARSDALARRLETAGAADQARRLEDHQQQSLEAARSTAVAQAQARTADDASNPLDPARAARLGDHDRELCRLAPDLCRPAEAGAPD